MPLTPESAITELHRAIPSFDCEWEEDHLSYPLFNDFARYICSEAEVLKYVESVDEARLLSEGNSDVRDLVTEAIETLSTCPHEREVKKWAGPEVSRIWNSQPWR